METKDQALTAEYWDRIIQNDINEINSELERKKGLDIIKIIIGAISIIVLVFGNMIEIIKGFYPENFSVRDVSLSFIFTIVIITFSIVLISLWINLIKPYIYKEVIQNVKFQRIKYFMFPFLALYMVMFGLIFSIIIFDMHYYDDPWFYYIPCYFLLFLFTQFSFAHLRFKNIEEKTNEIIQSQTPQAKGVNRIYIHLLHFIIIGLCVMQIASLNTINDYRSILVLTASLLIIENFD